MAIVLVLRPISQGWGEAGLHIGEISDLSIADHLLQLDKLSLTDNEATIARPILKEIMTG